LPNETRAGLLGIGVMIFWMLVTLGIVGLEMPMVGEAARPEIPAAVKAISPFSFVYGVSEGFAKAPPLVLAIAVQAVIAAGLWWWASKRVGMEGKS
jgi:hypothetical protein